MRRVLLTLVTAALFGAFAQSALAGGGSYSFVGGTAKQQATVKAALDASSFDWGLIPHTIVVHLTPGGSSYSVYGSVYLDARLLDSGRFSWGVVQHEFAHQVDFFLLQETDRAQLAQQLGGKDWCYSVTGLAHSDYGCERFASELAWAYWQSPDNSMRPSGPSDEAAAMPVAQFRALLTQLIGAPAPVASAPATPARETAFAPAVVTMKAHAPKPKPRTARRR